MDSSIKYFSVLIVFAVINGLLCGYTYGVVAGLIPLLEKSQVLSSNTQISIFAGAIALGCLLASIYTGILEDIFGRKKVMILTLLFFMAGLILFVFCRTFASIYVSRTLQGIGFGMAQVVVPMYLSELSPNRERGRVITSFQLSLTGGILLSSLLNIWLLPLTNWENIFYVLNIFPILLILITFILPESPRWYILKGHIDKAEKVLFKMNKKEDAEEELNKIKQLGKSHTNLSYKSIFKRKYFIPILIVTAAVSLNQLFGLPAFIQCSMKILHDTGIKSTVIDLLGSASITGINFLAVILTMLLVEKLGRRKILKIGNTALCISLVVLALVNFFMPDNELKGYITLIGIVVIVGFFSFGPGGVIFLICTELLPNKVRGIGITISFIVGATVGFVFVSMFLPLADVIGYGGLFLLIACFMFCYILLAKVIPETKGKTLEEIEMIFDKNK